MRLRILLISLLLTISNIGVEPIAASNATAKTLSPAAKVDQYAVGSSAGFYVVEWKCVPKRDPKSIETTRNLASLWKGDPWNGFGFYFTKGSLRAPLTKDTMTKGDSLLGAEVVYVTDGSNKGYSLFNLDCRGMLVVNAADSPYVSEFKGEARVSNEVLTKIASFVGKAVEPLYSLITAVALPERQSGILKSSKDILQAYSSDILPLFVREGGSTNSTPLVSGKTIKLSSPLADVWITVTKRDSLLLSNAPFKNTVDSLVKPSVKFTPEDLDEKNRQILRNKCNVAAQEWGQAGVTNDVDRAYVMMRAIRSAAPSKEAIIRCLDRQLALAALPYQDKRYLDLTGDFEYTRDDVDNYAPGKVTTNPELGPQPQGWNFLRETIIYVGDRTGRLLREPQAGELYAKFSPILRVEDETANYSILNKLDPDNKGVSFEGKPAEVLDRLRSAGFGRWSCMTLTDSAAGSVFKSQRAEAVIAVVSEKADGKENARASAIRILFKDKLIRSIVFTDFFSLDDYTRSICP